MNTIPEGPISDVRERDVGTGAMRESSRPLLRLTLRDFAGLGAGGLISSAKSADAIECAAFDQRCNGSRRFSR
jgi:hypothetical protein